MRTYFKNLFLVPVLFAALALLLAGRVPAQTFATLHSCTALKNNTNGDGALPLGALVLSGKTLYGTALFGGSWGAGTVFAVNTDGTGFTNLHTFTGGSDGGGPQAGLILSGSTLYGTTPHGGSSGYGTVFAVNTDGSGFTVLYNFSGTDGAFPASALIQSGNTLYGTTDWGGSSWGSGTLGRGFGSVFAVDTNGTSFATLYSFTGGSDGAHPEYAPLILSGNTLYGTTYEVISGNSGTVFAVNTDSTGFTTLHAFTPLSNGTYGSNSDGGSPHASLILLGGKLYGTASQGGSAGNGNVFAVSTDGTGFTNLHDFTGGSDGTGPQAGLILSGNTLYGTASSGGASGWGTVFAVNTDGTGFTTLYSFTAPSPNNINGINRDGAYPVAGLLLSGHTLYGTTYRGGSAASGTVFSLSLPIAPPQLTIIHSGANVILTWPTNASGFTLQSTANLGSSAVWTTNSPAPVVVNGQNRVTNPISGTQQFFRLSQ